MLKGLHIIVLFLLLHNGLYSQTYSAHFTDKEIYSFIEGGPLKSKRHREEPKLLRKRVKYKIEKWSSRSFKLPPEGKEDLWGEYLFSKVNRLDTLLSKTDIDFIIKQHNDIKDTVWHKPFKHVKMLNRKQRKPNVHYFSVPLFSNDKQTALIQMSYHCGDLCAYGGTYVYRRVNQKWVLVGVINSWVS